MDTFFPLIPDTLLEAVVLLDHDLNLLYGNAEALRKGECTEAELCTRHCYDIWSDGSVCPGCPVIEAFETKKPVKGEILLPSGTVQMVHAVPFAEEDGSVQRVLRTSIEVSDLTNCSSHFLETQERLSLALAAGGFGIYDVDIPGMEITVDEQFARILGTSTEALGTDPREVFDYRIYPHDRRHMRDVLKSVFYREMSFVEGKCRIRHETKGWVWIHIMMQVSRRDDDGNPLRLTGVIQDISEICRTKQSMKNATKKIHLLSSITRHDIMNQVRVIKLTRRRLQEIHPQVAEEIQPYQHIFTEAMGTIDSLIKFSAEYQDLGMQEPRWYSIEEQISRVYAENEIFHVFSLVINGPLPQVYTDPLIERVFFSLFENILVHSGGADTVTISFCNGADEGVLSIADNGKGVAPAEKNKIFEHGYGENTGYGLFLSREILAVTDIQIDECGTEGEGAVFRIFGSPDIFRFVTGD